MHLCLAKSPTWPLYMHPTSSLYLLLTCGYCRSVPDSRGISPISGIMICMKEEEENTILVLEVEVEVVALPHQSS